jgi:site-specific DNA recombinase
MEKLDTLVTDLSELMLKDRIAELKAIRDQARADTERADGAIERQGPIIPPDRSRHLPGPPR